MSKVLAYIGLHLKLQFGRDKKADKRGQIMSIIIGIVTVGVMLFLLKYFFDIALGTLKETVSISDFSTIIFTIIELVLVIFGISLEIKYLLQPFDIKITARFPLSNFQMFVADLVIVYIYMLMMSFVCFGAIMLIYGWSGAIISFVYILRVLLMAFFAPMMPFALSLVLSVPTMFIMTLLKNQPIIKLVLFVLLLAGAFVTYSMILDFLAEYYVHQTIGSSTEEALITFVTAINHKANICVWLKNMVFGSGYIIDILLVVAVAVGGTALGLFLAKMMYDKVRRQTQEGTGKFFAKKTHINGVNAFGAIMIKELKTILRTSTYSYFYLGVAITTPAMVFLCDSLVGKIGEAQVGQGVAFGVFMLVLFAFVAMICSFAATSISRENDTFYITKLTPLDYRKQLIAKGLLNLIVAAGALLLSVAIIMIIHFAQEEIKTVEPLQAGIAFVTALIGACGLIFNGFNINLRYPCLAKQTDGEISETNMTRMILFGMLLCGVEGGLAIILPPIMQALIDDNPAAQQAVVYIIILAVAIIYAVINFVVFWKTANKKYERIEYR